MRSVPCQGQILGGYNILTTTEEITVAHLFGLLAIRPSRFNCCQTKVTDFHSKVVIVKKYVVGFQVPATNKD